MLFNKIIFLLFFSYSLLVSLEAHAADQSKWELDRQKVLNLKDCNKKWKILWPWAKIGNLEARFIIFYLMLEPLPDVKARLLAPGNSGDLISLHRDLIMFLVFSEGYNPDEKIFNNTWDENLKIETYKMMGFSNHNPGKLFLRCLEKTTPKSTCVKLAVDKNLVPSFDQYAKQIDIFAANGLIATCK